MGTPFLYKPSRMLGAMGTKNNQETTWTDRLDAEHITPYRSGMAGLLPMPGELPSAERPEDRRRRPLRPRRRARVRARSASSARTSASIAVESVIRLNNICNDLGFDTASTGSAIAWAMELYQRGIITREQTGGLDLTWGNAEAVERAAVPDVARAKASATSSPTARARSRRGTTRARRCSTAWRSRG